MEEDKSQVSDTSLQRKHAAMIERLNNLHQSRISGRKSDPENPPDSTSSFLSRFSRSKLSIESDLSRIKSSVSDPAQLKSDLDKASDSIADLEKLVAESSYFLPSYEVRTCLQTISELKQTLDRVSSDVIPRKKFSFRNKSKKPNGVVSTDKQDISPENNQTVPKFESLSFDSPGFRNAENEVLVKELNGEGVGEFMLSDLRNCEVQLLGKLGALFVHKLRDCRIYVGPVLGSILIEEVEGCVFVVASHQIRIHHAKSCDFYLRVRSRPIIEDCTGVRFAPYCLSYDEIDKDLEEANLAEEMGNWANVDDFRWLRAVQSPNWAVIPENERIGVVNISRKEI